MTDHLNPFTGPFPAIWDDKGDPLPLPETVAGLVANVLRYWWTFDDRQQHTHS